MQLAAQVGIALGASAAVSLGFGAVIGASSDDRRESLAESAWQGARATGLLGGTFGMLSVLGGSGVWGPLGGTAAGAYMGAFGGAGAYAAGLALGKPTSPLQPFFPSST